MKQADKYNSKHITMVQAPCLRSGGDTGCGECQSSCQSACKTSCTIANQKCDRQKK